MALPPAPPLGLLREAGSLLRRHSRAALAVAIVSALLAALGPLLQLRLKLPDTLEVQALLGAMSVVPLELWLLPRILLHCDAESLGHPLNPAEGWQARFEARWGLAVGTRLLFYALVFLGGLCFILPGLLVLYFFGWAPLRVLLRGGGMAEAFRWSRGLMRRAWLPAVLGAVQLSAGYLLGLSLLGMLLGLRVADPTPQDRLFRPLLWAGQAAAGLLNLWFSLGFLVLYQRLEPLYSPEPESDESR